MIADYFSKPPQGGLFKTFRDQILGIVPIPHTDQDHRSVLELRRRKKNEVAGDLTNMIKKERC